MQLINSKAEPCLLFMDQSYRKALWLFKLPATDFRLFNVCLL